MMALNMMYNFFYLHQRVALSTVVNICKKLPSECPSPFMEAVPILCNLLQYEDRQAWMLWSSFFFKMIFLFIHLLKSFSDLSTYFFYFKFTACRICCYLLD